MKDTRTKILITGSKGFIAQNLISFLSPDSYIKTLSINSNDYKVDLIKEIPSINEKFDIVIILAGIAHKTIKNKCNYNIKIVNNLLKGFSISSMPKKIILISSVSVYGLVSGQNIVENSPLLAKDEYGISKILIESITQDFCYVNKVSLTILRLPLVVGTNTPGNFKSLLKNIKYGIIVTVNFGVARKSIIHIDDLCNYIKVMPDYPGIYNLTDGIHPSMLDIINKLNNNNKNVFNIPYYMGLIFSYIGTILFLPFNYKLYKKYTSTLTFDDTKARSAFCWNPSPALERKVS